MLSNEVPFLVVCHTYTSAVGMQMSDHINRNNVGGPPRQSVISSSLFLNPLEYLQM